MNILVTGGAGYLGSVLVPHLVTLGHQVTVMDNLHYGDAKFPTKDYLSEKYFGNILAMPMVEERVQGQDAVIHLAALRLEECETNPAEAFRVNLEGTRRVLKSAEQAGVKRFIFASTCSNYGIAEGIADEDTELMPTTIYAMTKTYAEEFVRNSPIGVVLRFGTLYGPSPNMRYDTLINKLAQQIAKADGMFILHDSDSWRPFLHVEDAASAIAEIAGQGFFGCSAINLPGENIQKRDLFSIAKFCFPRFNISLAEGKDTRSYRVSQERVYNLLEWRPRYSVAGTFIPLVQHIRKENYEKASR